MNNEVAIRPIIPHDYDSAMKMAIVLHKSGLTIKSLDTPEKVFAAMQLGASVGLSPMQSVQNIAVINGRPALYGDAQLAVTWASGKLEYIKESIQGDKEFTATCIVKRKGQDPVTAVFTHADAVKAGLLSKTGPWSQYPKRMTQMRARSFALRDVFPDVLLGLAHTVEEMQSEDMRDITPIELPIRYQFYDHVGNLGETPYTPEEAITFILEILQGVATPEHWKAYQGWKNNNREVLSSLSKEHPGMLEKITELSKELQAQYG